MGKRTAAQGTGRHVIWKGKPLTGWKKGSRAQGDRKSRGLEGKTADGVEKRMAGSGGPEVPWFGVGNR